MGIKLKETIIKEIEEFKAEIGGDYNDFYIGITNEPIRRLIEGEESFETLELNEHVSSGKLDSKLFYLANAGTNEIAVEIEVEFQTKGMQGLNPESKGVKGSTYLYCFKVATKEATDIQKKQIRMLVRKEIGLLIEKKLIKFKEFETDKKHIKPFGK